MFIVIVVAAVVVVVAVFIMPLIGITATPSHIQRGKNPILVWRIMSAREEEDKRTDEEKIAKTHIRSVVCPVIIAAQLYSKVSRSRRTGEKKM